MTVRLTGEVAIGHEELETVSRGAGLGALAAIVLVSIVLGVGLRAWQLVLASVLTLLARADLDRRVRRVRRRAS